PRPCDRLDIRGGGSWHLSPGKGGGQRIEGRGSKIEDRDGHPKAIRPCYPGRPRYRLSSILYPLSSTPSPSRRNLSSSTSFRSWLPTSIRLSIPIHSATSYRPRPLFCTSRCGSRSGRNRSLGR